MLILTDINMPGMDGEEFLRRLEADEMLRGLPVIVISTDATAGPHRANAGAGRARIRHQAFTPEALRAELERTLGVPCA